LGVPVKAIHWVIALLGLWEFGDIAALFTPGFGEIRAFVWNHIFVGLILMIVGAWAALTKDKTTAYTMNWIAIAAGVWLLVASFILGNPIHNVGIWNDVLVAGIVIVLAVWSARSFIRRAD